MKYSWCCSGFSLNISRSDYILNGLDYLSSLHFDKWRGLCRPDGSCIKGQIKRVCGEVPKNGAVLSYC